MSNKWQFYIVWNWSCYGTVTYPFMDSSEFYINREPSTLKDIGYFTNIRLTSKPSLCHYFSLYLVTSIYLKTYAMFWVVFSWSQPGSTSGFYCKIILISQKYFFWGNSKWWKIKKISPSLNRDLSSKFFWLRSANYVKFTEECVTCMERNVICKKIFLNGLNMSFPLQVCV